MGVHLMLATRHAVPALLLTAACLSAGCRSVAPPAVRSPATSCAGSAAAPRPAGVELSPGLADAAPPADGEPETSRWRHSATLYGWVPNLKGDVTVRGVDAEPHVTRGDVLDDLDLAFSGRYEVRPPDSEWSFFADVFHARLAVDESAPTARAGTVDADVEMRMTFVEAGAVLHYWESSEQVRTRAGALARTQVDFYGGARYTRTRLDLDLRAPAVGQGREFDETGDWTDPLVGTRLRHSLAPDLWFVGRADIGGFDVGSHRTWTATGTLQYLISESLAVGAGWRVMDIVRHGGPDLDVRMSGPFVTLTYEF